MIIRAIACTIALLLTTPDTGLAADAARAISKSTRHLAVTATLTPALVRPGTKMQLAVDIRPKKGMHVYAPGTKYRAVAVALDANPGLTVHETIYPPPTTYLFKPLNEQVLVYERPFRLRLDITAGGTPAQQTALNAQSRLTIMGHLTYQACDDAVCYLPASIPFEWSTRIAR